VADALLVLAWMLAGVYLYAQSGTRAAPATGEGDPGES